jgi:hypothetical protein
LVHACSKIGKTKPSLLSIKAEVPSLLEAGGGVGWETMVKNLEKLEIRFEEFRKLAIAMSSSTANDKVLDPSTLTVEDEIELLQTTSIGIFAADACLRMASIYEVFDATKESHKSLASYFSKDDDDSGDEVPKISVDEAFGVVARFCEYTDARDF